MQEEVFEDFSAIEPLFLENHKILCNLANRIVRDRSAAEDVVQEVFLKLWQKRNEIKIESTLKGYLYKAVANASLDYLESNKKIQLKENMEESQKAYHPEFESQLSQDFMEKKFREALENLPPKCKAIFVLSRYEGLKHKEIAEHLNISIKTVETQIGIALDRLKKDLKPYMSQRYLVTVSAFLLALLYFIDFI